MLKMDKSTLVQEIKKIKQIKICKKCYVEDVGTLFLPCRHLIVCDLCAEKLDLCLLCRGKIRGTVKVVMVP